MKRRFRFNAEAIKPLCPAETGRRDTYYDTGCKGLCLRVTDRGAKTFFVQKKVNGKSRKITLGRFETDGTGISADEARRRARIQIGEIERGYDPQVEVNRRRSIPTLGDYFKRWLDLHGKVGVTEETWRQKRAAFKKHCFKLVNTRMDQITKENTRGLITRMMQRGLQPRTANGVRTILNQLYRQAIDDGVLPRDFEIPLHPKLKEPRGRKRFLKPDEVPRLFAALSAYRGKGNSDPEIMKAFILMLLFTGQRRGNVLAMRWDQIDFDSRIWEIPANETKSRRIYSNLLTDYAWVVLMQQRRRWSDRSDWVFPNVLDPGQHLKSPKKAWESIRIAAGLPDLRMHDLRHTFGTYQYLATRDLKLVKDNLHHLDIATTEQIYTHLDTDEHRRIAAARGTEHMLGSLDPKSRDQLLHPDTCRLLASA